MTRLPIIAGDEGKIRVVFEIGIQDPEFDAFVVPCIYHYDNSWNFIGSVDLNEERLPTGPGRFRLVGKTYAPPAGATYASPIVRFYGNAVKVFMKSAAIEPAIAKPIYTSTGRRIPPVRYSVDSAQPDFDSAILSDAQITTRLNLKSKAVPQLLKKNDRIELLVDGNSVPPVINMCPYFGHPFAYYKQMYNAGAKITTITIRTGPYGDTPGAPSNIWLGDGQYNFEPVRQAIRYVLARCPDTYIILNLWINVYNDWATEHPDHVHANANGEKGICSWSRVTRYGGAAPTGGEFWEASNHSGQFAQDGGEMLRDFGAWLESAPEGKVVIGAYLNGSADGQWLFSNEATFAEYNPGTLAAYKTFLTEKYQTNAALSAAWGMSVTFDTVQIPTAVSRFTSPDGRQFLTLNNQNCRLADFNAFLSISNTRRQIAFCRALKESTNGRLLCGQYWPTLPASYPLAHGDYWEMLNSPYVDFVSRGGMFGATLHGKLAIHEFDLRNLKSGIETWIDYDDPSVAKSQAEFKRQTLAGFCRELTAGAGFHIWDMWGGWFWHPDTMTIFNESLQITKHVSDSPSLGSNYVGVFVDEDASNHLISLGWYFNWPGVEKPFTAMGQGGAAGWGRTGLPVKFFLMQDALNPDLVVPKVSIFLNALTMTLPQANLIKSRFCSDGRVIVFMNTPGLAAPGDLYNPVNITGFSVCVPAGWTALRDQPLLVLNSTDPLLTGIRANTRLGNWPSNSGMLWFDTSAVANADTIGTPLAKYHLTNGEEWVGMLVNRAINHTMVWIGAPGALSPALIRNFAKEAGMTPLLENDNEIMVGAGLLAVVGIKGGPQQVKLPSGFYITGCLTGHSYQVENGVLKFELGWGDRFGDVAIFTAPAAACGDPQHPYPHGDLNNDCYVNLADLAILSKTWLNCTAPDAPCNY